MIEIFIMRRMECCGLDSCGSECCGLDSCGSESGEVAGCCVRGDERSDHTGNMTV